MGLWLPVAIPHLRRAPSRAKTRLCHSTPACPGSHITVARLHLFLTGSFISVNAEMSTRTVIALLGLLVVALFSTAFAHPYYQKKIPNGNNVIGGKWPGTLSQVRFARSCLVSCANSIPCSWYSRRWSHEPRWRRQPKPLRYDNKVDTPSDPR